MARLPNGYLPVIYLANGGLYVCTAYMHFSPHSKLEAVLYASLTIPPLLH